MSEDFSKIPGSLAWLAAQNSTPNPVNGSAEPAKEQRMKALEQELSESTNVLFLLLKAEETRSAEVKKLIEKLVKTQSEIQRKQADLLFVVDGVNNDEQVRRALCEVLDQNGADGVTSFLQKRTVKQLQDEIRTHIVWLERRAVQDYLYRRSQEEKIKFCRLCMRSKDLHPVVSAEINGVPEYIVCNGDFA